MRYSRGTQAEQARREGVHPSTVSRRVRKGADLSSLDNTRRNGKRDEQIRRRIGE